MNEIERLKQRFAYALGMYRHVLGTPGIPYETIHEFSQRLGRAAIALDQAGEGDFVRSHRETVRGS